MNGRDDTGHEQACHNDEQRVFERDYPLFAEIERQKQEEGRGGRSSHTHARLGDIRGRFSSLRVRAQAPPCWARLIRAVACDRDGINLLTAPGVTGNAGRVRREMSKSWNKLSSWKNRKSRAENGRPDGNQPDDQGHSGTS